MTARMRIQGALAILGLAALFACGGSTTDVSGSDGGSIGDASSGDGSIDSATDGAVDGSRDASDASPDSSRTDAGVPINHRPNDSQCQTTPAAGNCQIMVGGGQCQHDTDCTTGTNGRCVEGNGGARFCFCAYDACMHDSDCPTGKLCVCHGSAYNGGGNTCIEGNCRVDADCASGYCSPSHGTSGCGGVTGYYCHTSNDTCTNDSDCRDGGLQVCAWSASHSRWECQQELLCP